MPKRAAKAKPAEKPDFNTFMKKMKSKETFRDLNNVEEVFYKVGDSKLNNHLCGGIPSNQIIEVRGPSGAGKSLMALEISRSIVNAKRKVLYFDIETKISKKALRAFGLLDNEDFDRVASETLEDTLEILMEALESDLFGGLVIDSCDALVTDEQNDRDIHDGSKVGGYKAKLFSEWLSKISQLCAAHDCAIILVRQVRDKPDGYGNPETVSGGRAIEFYSTIGLRVSPNKKDDITEDKRITYQGARITITKSNQGPRPSDPLEVRFYIGDDHEWGLDKYTSVYDDAKRLGLLAPLKPNSNKHVPCDDLCVMLDAAPEDLSFNGKEATKRGIRENADLFNALETLIDQGCSNVREVDDVEDEVDFEEE